MSLVISNFLYYKHETSNYISMIKISFLSDVNGKFNLELNCDCLVGFFNVTLRTQTYRHKCVCVWVRAQMCVAIWDKVLDIVENVF